MGPEQVISNVQQRGTGYIQLSGNGEKTNIHLNANPIYIYGLCACHTLYRNQIESPFVHFFLSHPSIDIDIYKYIYNHIVYTLRSAAKSRMPIWKAMEERCGTMWHDGVRHTHIPRCSIYEYIFVRIFDRIKCEERAPIQDIKKRHSFWFAIQLMGAHMQKHPQHTLDSHVTCNTFGQRNTAQHHRFPYIIDDQPIIIPCSFFVFCNQTTIDFIRFIDCPHFRL